MPPTSIRLADLSDIDALVAVARSTQQFHTERAPGHFLQADDEALHRFLSDAVTDEMARVIVVVDEVAPLRGYAILRIQHRDVNPFTASGIVVEVDQFGVLPEFEGRGVGTALIQRAIEIAQDLKAVILRLTVWQFNERAISLYERNGFEVAQLRMTYPLGNRDDMRVRNAVPDDADAIANLNTQAWRVGFRGVVSDAFLETHDGAPDGRRAVLESPEPDSIQLVTVGHDDVPIGWLSARPAEDADLDPATTFEVRACYTHPDHWRKGVARMMVEHLWHHLAGTQWTHVVLWTARDADRSRSFYEAMGFVFDGTEKTADYGGPVALVRYGRQL